MIRATLALLFAGLLIIGGGPIAFSSLPAKLAWQSLPPVPHPEGTAGAAAGVHNDVFILAGGTHFPKPVWESDRVWMNEIWVLQKVREQTRWSQAGSLPHAMGYASSATTPRGVAVLGGTDGTNVFTSAFLMTWNSAEGKVVTTPLPELPESNAYGAAVFSDGFLYIAGGQTGTTLETAGTLFARLDFSRANAPDWAWQMLPSWPGTARAFNLLAAQHNGFNTRLYLISGRRSHVPAEIEGVAGTAATPEIFCLQDHWEFDPQVFGSGIGTPWRTRAPAPVCLMAGAAMPVGQSHIFVPAHANGDLIARTAELKLDHPGFPRRVYAYHTITDTWIDAGESPANPVTTPAVKWGNDYILAAGEEKPRVRTNAVWALRPVSPPTSFGALNYTVLIVYLAAMVGVGFWFSRKNKNTNDYFRGGQNIAWWVAACSIFATMLSSITYMAIPAKAYAQDLVYLLGNMMILAVAPIAIYLALPFFRRIDATSAYEYLEKRFNRPVRWFASASFTLFHLFRMGIVMSLAGLALATVTPLTAPQCVLLMGVLSMLYCTLGGLEAVVWTDTLQTFVLLGGAIICLALMLSGIEGGVLQGLSEARAYGKLHAVNFHMDPTSASLALWVVIIGAIGQNFSSYTADQAVVQRYMTTRSIERARKSIWTAALMAIPASILFYVMGTALWAFYRSHPEKLDPTFTTDQIFPLFISHEVPAGLAGLIVAGIFAAAQSTVSTSMNSTATTVLTDFIRPFGFARDEKVGLRVAMILTFSFGIAGTLLGLLFVHPDIKSLFDSFLKVIGLFMGVLGGLFALGMLTRKANGPGTLVGALAGAAVMGWMPGNSNISGYLYAAIGIMVCVVLGYIVSCLIPTAKKDLQGLTIHSEGRS